MFEEDSQRCFICQKPCQGLSLYCSSECRQQDRGSNSPSIKALGDAAPVKLTAQLPPSLSPAVRPVYNVAPVPSPMFIARRSRTSSSSSSSISESPLQSPKTNPSVTDSPQKEVFNLPPPAYPSAFGFGASVPVKIPASLSARTATATNNGGAVTPGSQATFQMPSSMDTLRFGRKSSVTNSVTSPHGLLPRCGCGRALGHPPRSRDRSGEVDNIIACLSLGPSVTAGDDNALGFRTTPRTPTFSPVKEESVSSMGVGASLLSRSRSNPKPSIPKDETVRAIHHGIHPRPSVSSVLRTPPPPASAKLPAVAPSHPRSRSAVSSSNTITVDDESRRGRSRERINAPRGLTTPERNSAAGLPDFHEERETAPSRMPRDGRHRSRDRNSKTFEFERGRPGRVAA